MNPAQIYASDRLEFNVLRKGKHVGNHQVVFGEEEGRLRVTATTEIELKFLRIPIYSFQYRSHETWCQGRLIHIETKVIENGDERIVTADASELVAPRNGRTAFATNHWNSQVLKAPQIFNSISGKFNRVTFADVGMGVINYNDTELLATRYRTTGDLEIELWYDDLGRWVKLAFLDKVGAKVEFVCGNCGEPEILATTESADAGVTP